MQKSVDAVVVGGGVAGMSAALFLGRAGRSTILYDGGASRMLAAEHVREFLGFDAWRPQELLQRARAEVLRYGAAIREELVERIEPREDGSFDVTSTNGTVRARSIVLATGLIDVLPPLEGLPAVWGRDLHVCPCFDGFEVRSGRFVVFGLPERLAQLGSWVTMWSPNVTVVSPNALDAGSAQRLNAAGVRIAYGDVTGLIHERDELVAVSTSEGEIACDAAWIAAPVRAASSLAASLCVVDSAGFAKTDADGRTSRAGVFAVGNATDPVAHLAHAAAAGTRVGPVVTLYLLEASLRRQLVPTS